MSWSLRILPVLVMRMECVRVCSPGMAMADGPFVAGPACPNVSVFSSIWPVAAWLP